MSENKPYRTRQREEILECLNDIGTSHVTAAEVAKRMRERGSGVGLTTIYRYLDKMVEQGELRRFYFDATNAACYQLHTYGEERKECCRHYHLKCEKCAGLFHVTCDEIDRFTEHIRQSHGFAINYAATVFYGLCEACASQEAQETKEI